MATGWVTVTDNCQPARGYIYIYEAGLMHNLELCHRRYLARILILALAFVPDRINLQHIL